MNELGTFIAASVVVEALISYIDVIFVKKHIQWKTIVAIVIGCLLSFDLNLNVFTLLHIHEAKAIVGTALTGIIISRGSNYVFDLYDRLTNWKKESMR